MEAVEGSFALTYAGSHSETVRRLFDFTTFMLKYLRISFLYSYIPLIIIASTV